MLNKSQPIIGITVKSGSYNISSYCGAVRASGGIPIALVPESKKDIARVNGIILSGGGNDINPRLYGQKRHIKTTAWDSKRDKFEIRLVKYAVKTKIPLLAICRGIQLLNVAFGGTLLQDIKSDHRRRHNIHIKESSALSRLAKSKNAFTNSDHHQAVGRLGRGFSATSRSGDGIIESIEMKPGNFVIGVQFHPELMIKNSAFARNLFSEFIKECIGGRKWKSTTESKKK